MAENGTLRVGLFGVGLAAYWNQFEGLEARLQGYLDQVAGRIAAPGREIVNLGLVDSVEKGVAAGHRARREDVDLLVLYVTTYALSSTVLPVVRRARVPVLVLALQPEAAIEYERFNALPDRTAMTGEWLAYCSACPAPEIANVFARAGIAYHQVVGVLEDDAHCWREIEDWLAAAQAMEQLSHLRLGLMGHYYGGMLDIATDLTALAAVFGVHPEQLELDELTTLAREMTSAEIGEKLSEFRNTFDIQPDCPAEELIRAARTAAALDELVRLHSLGALAYFYNGTGGANEDTISSIILGTSLLTGRGVPVAGEYEVKNVIAMKIMDSLAAGGSFTEYYAVDFRDDVVLMGHDGPGHPAIAPGRVKVKPLQVYHGKVGRGLSVEMSVKNGAVTLLSVAEDGRGSFKLIVAEGMSEPGPILEIGNTNSRYRFSIGAREFVQRWNQQAPAHHCAVGVGHTAGKLEKLGKLLGLEVARVC